MNTPVSLPIAKLLKEKGFDKPTFGFYSYSSNKYDTYSQLIRVNLLSDNYAAPTIADVVMWLYEKHGIWISVYQYKDHAADNNDPILFRSKITGRNEWLNESNSPTKEYEAAFDYILNNLI